MYLENLNFLQFFIFVFFVIILITYIYYWYKKQKNILSLSFLIISTLFILVNIFWIKTSFNISKQTKIWWKILFVMDVSKSMNTIDINDKNKLISRLDFTKNIIKNYVSFNNKNKYWLSIFAWESIELLPFTSNYWMFLKLLNWVNNDNISKNWSELVWVFESVLDYFWSEDNWTVVIFTDWWDDKIEVLKDTVNKINSKKINVFLVWVWSLKWNYIPEGYDVWWDLVYKRYNWKKILSKLNNSNLKKISNKFGFDYYKIDDKKKLAKLEKEISLTIEKNTIINDSNNRVYLTRFLVFLSFIFFILFLIFDKLVWKK